METTPGTQTRVSHINVEIWSDVMCPFCYIGKRHFETALNRFVTKAGVSIEWKSFQLDPGVPEDTDGMSSVEYLALRKGISPEQVTMMHERVTEMAKDAGLTYHLDNAVVFNSFKAHRMIQLAKTVQLADAAEERLFHAYFTESRDLGNVETLIALGQEIGLTETQVNEALTNDDYAYKVTQDIQEAQQIGVTGVPFFVFNRKYAVSGAQPTDVFLQTLQKVYSEPN